jgi:FtsP/CotA-like multicopper oxidase with cupredoxin domain
MLLAVLAGDLSPVRREPDAFGGTVAVGVGSKARPMAVMDRAVWLLHCHIEENTGILRIRFPTDH